ncbi:MAG: type I-E CRISPR-associated protein Cse1/CasA [Phycisphaerae bacterium]|nr:type I-E CRISPR-associated protein Cse1/CasA [Phycisphaerae bacterium]
MNFNLIDEPFIPCLMADGTQRDWGLRDVLTRAPEIREVRDESPLVTIALHRLLLAILHRNFGPTSLKEWKRLWTAGQFDTSTLNGYFERWHDRFDLFNPQHPFYQTGNMVTKDPLPAAALFDHYACNNNATLFDHTVNDPPLPLDFAATARGLIYRQAFALGLGVSPDVVINGRPTKTGNRQDSTLARGLILLVRGENLFQTLMCNLTATETADDDLPVWERDDPEVAIGLGHVTGRLDLYTAQSRRLLLILPQDGDGRLIRQIHFAQGRKVADETDPMKPYRRHEKLGWLVMGLDAERAVWRDSAALLALAHDSDRPVAALNWMARAIADGILPPGRQWALDVFGAATQPGKATSLLLFRHERMPLPLTYLAHGELVETLAIALQRAQDAAESLEKAAWRTARETLKPTTEDGSLGKKDRDAITAKADAIAPSRLYWSRLEVPFHRFLVDLAETGADTQHALAQWVLGTVVPSARAAYDHSIDLMDSSSRFVRAVAMGRQTLEMGLNHLSKTFKEHQHGQT